MSQSLEIAACRDVLGLIRSDQFPEVAVQALVDGYDSASLRKLAGLTAPHAEARSLFHRILGEMGVPTPDRREAVLRLASDAAKRILRGEIEPYEGAREIWDLTLTTDLRFPELDTFVYGASEWDERPEDRRILRDEIMAAAMELADNPPRSKVE